MNKKYMFKNYTFQDKSFSVVLSVEEISLHTYCVKKHIERKKTKDTKDQSKYMIVAGKNHKTNEG